MFNIIWLKWIIMISLLIRKFFASLLIVENIFLYLCQYWKRRNIFNVKNKEGGGINYTFLHFIKTQHVENSGI